MTVLVAYASRHGSTKGIAERIVGRLVAAGIPVEGLPVQAVRDVKAYDAVVLGSALYMFHWLGEARSFASRNRSALAARPVWLFSSGPLGPGTVDKQGRDLREVSGPREIDQLRRMVKPRDHRVFFGAWDQGHKPVGFWEHIVLRMPAARAGLPNSDLRDWPNIEAWADGIAKELAATTRR